MRRTIKPFTVEVRSSSRRTRIEAPKAPVWPELAEQPVVEWPDALLPPAAAPEPAPSPPVENVPAIEAEAAFSAPAEPYRDPRKPPPVPVAKPEQVVHVSAAEAPAEERSGRILPVIKLPPPPDVKPSVEDVTPVAPRSRTMRAKPVKAAELSADPPPIAEAETAAAVVVPRQGMDRTSRGDLKRGERWKARLPAAAHRPKRK